MRLKAVTIAATTLFVTSNALAETQQIIVSDCESTPRLIEDLGDIQKVGLRASVVDSQSAKVVVTLTSSTGDPLIQATDAGSVEFENLTPGQWTMCLEPASAEASDIEIIRPSSETFQAVSVVGASAAGVLAIALGSSDSGGSSGGASSADTSGIISSTASATQPLEVSPAAAVSNKPPTAPAEDAICFIGENEEVEPISVFK